MEFSALIDKLDDVVANGKKVRFGSDVRVDREETYAIVDQLRGAIPEELKQANWIAENRDEMLEEARHETARILEQAREERARLLGREEIEREAEQRAHKLLERAGTLEREIRLGAEDYAGDILASLETYLVKLAEAVERGRGQLGERSRDGGVERGGDRVPERQAVLAA
jgi:hypothetical protein